MCFVFGAWIVWGPNSEECQVWGSVGLGVGFLFPGCLRGQGPQALWGVILLCFSFIFHMMLPWGHICFIVSVQVTCVWGFVLPLSSSACQLVYFVPYASGYQLRSDEDWEFIQSPRNAGAS